MVKFGRHALLYQQENSGSYVVPYNKIKSDIEENVVSLQDFEKEWNCSLQQARQEFDESLQHLWERVFSSVDPEYFEEIRGAPPQKALSLFAQHAPHEKVQDILFAFKSIHATALINAESLRKLVKKYDKNHKPIATNGDNEIAALSTKLLPKVYASNFVFGLAGLRQGAELLRNELGLGFAHPSFSSLTKLSDLNTESPRLDPRQTPETEHDASGHPFAFNMLKREDKRDSHREHIEQVDRRRLELIWLRESVERIEKLNMLQNLVAHRGFHSPKDRSDLRPLENSLQAYESAWTSGIHLCECDIALTKDEKLILAHDQDFSRLALDSGAEKSKRSVQSLTFQDILSVHLKSGSRPPLLLDVLQSANALGGQAQLVIEIKPGNREAANAVAKLFGLYPHLMAQCAVIMSFDSFIMHSLREEMDALFGSFDKNEDGNAEPPRHRYSLGIMEGPSEMHSYKQPKLLLLTVSDAPKHEVELQVSIGQDDAVDQIHGWIKGRLDGVYMQFERQMLTPQGIDVLQKLAGGMECVGVWGHNGRDPDDYSTMCKLVQDGRVSFFNTDLPREFFE